MINPRFLLMKDVFSDPFQTIEGVKALRPRSSKFSSSHLGRTRQHLLRYEFFHWPKANLYGGSDRQLLISIILITPHSIYKTKALHIREATKR